MRPSVPRERQQIMPERRAVVNIKRAYEEPSPDDGVRVLVDRLWPRGLAKDRVHIDLWLREVAPGSDLRRWYGHDPAKWEEFQRRYTAQLATGKQAVALEHLREMVRQGPVTLVFAARDVEHSDAAVLRQLLARKSG
jgi:uncharacterized protein YeaO (DUF488 family)